MNRNDLMDFINWLEINTPVTSWQAEGVNVWPIIRINIYFENFKKNDRTTPANNSKIQFKNASLKNRRFSLFLNNPRHDHTADCLFVTNSICNKLVMDKYINIYTDPVIEKLKSEGKKSIVLEQEKITNSSPMPNGPRFYISQDLTEFAKKHKLDKVKCYVQDMEKVIIILAKKGFKKTANYILNNFRNLRFLVNKKYFQDILSRVKPKSVYFTCYYGEKMAFVSAAREIGIQTIDLQHGIQGDYHAAYGRWENVPSSGYSMLPDVFSVWSDKEKDSIITWSSKLQNSPHQAQVDGNPWLDMWKQKNPTTRYYDDLFSREFPSANGRKRLLFTHQDSYSWPDWFPTALQRTTKDFDIFFRVHPGANESLPSWRKYFKDKGINNIILERATNWPLLALMRHMDVHVTCYSSCVIEAETLGVPSLVITDDGETYFKDQIQKGTCKRVKSADDFLINL
ncbi:hypothetical protein [Desulfonatronovibrio magnus]|uniref:hypothetical protein n=1 Tax=Desulfonatronovibrio magnus TaxID=698827 RepID=UPI0005EB6C5C|nr:hypothetical protein [Desulfonatronovibrio magnus]